MEKAGGGTGSGRSKVGRGPSRGCILAATLHNPRFHLSRGGRPFGDRPVPNTESAKKRVRQSVKRQALNQWRKRRVKNQVKSFLDALQSKDVSAAEAELRKVASVLDKVSSTSTMHRNTAARRKSRLARRLNALKSAPAA
ncbi:MAG: 30S ribosomal protein S20 [Phycisphaerae bacterium]|nr:30S ribosomal protein S20 [Phycisphaerae bacterium]